MSDQFASYQTDSNNEDPTGYAQNREMNPATETGGTVRVSSHGDGQVSSEVTGVTSSQALDRGQIQPEGDVLGSLQTRYGAPKSAFGGRADPTDTVELRPGLRTSVANAAQLGLVRVGTDGSLQVNPGLAGPGEITPSQAQATAEQSAGPQQGQGQGQQGKGPAHTQRLPEDPHVPVELEDRKMTAAIDTMSRGLDPITLREINRQLASGQVTSQGLEQVASTLGMPFEDAAEIIGAASAGYKSLQDSAFNQAGLATERVQEQFNHWANREKTSEFRQAQASIFAFQSNTELAKLSRDFMASYDQVDPDETMGMLSDAGYRNVRKTDGGSVVFDHPEVGTISWRQAYQQGLFRTPVAKTR